MTPLKQFSNEYICWHEAGHVLVAYGVGTTVTEVVTNEKASKTTVQYYDLDEAVKTQQRRYITCGGLAAEYLLYQQNLILNSNESAITEAQFTKSWNTSCSDDKLRFFGEDFSVNGFWPKEYDEFFMEIALKNALPILNENQQSLKTLWQELVAKKKMTGKEIEELIPTDGMYDGRPL